MPTQSYPLGPVVLPPNPVWRSYLGGSVLRKFRGQIDQPDSHFPEDWLASVVRARNANNAQGPDEGPSRIGNGVDGEIFEAALSRAPEFWFGPASPVRTGTGVLWKLLDSFVRLQFQAHPDSRFARQHLNSSAGKTECWYILGTRGEACVYLGFQRPPTRSEWGRMIREQRVDDMLKCFEKIPVQAGDCYVVPAGTPHAIGAGVFMVELMEPTDWVVRCETVTAGLALPPEACFMGLDLETCLDIFDYRAYSIAEVRKNFQQSPLAITQTDAFTEEEVIGPAWHEFFRLHRLHGAGNATWRGDELLLLIALKGQGELSAGSEVRSVRAGETWLLPGAVPQWKWRATGALNGSTVQRLNGSKWELLLAKLPIVSTVERLNG